MSIDLDPKDLPRDWRTVVRSGAFLILLAGAVGAVAAPISLVYVRPIENRLEKLEHDEASIGPYEDKLDAHLAEMSALRPMMNRYLDEQSKVNCGMARNIFELCRLTPGARCVPMGASCP